MKSHTLLWRRLVLCAVVLVAACSTATQNAATYVLDKQCHSELESRRDWRVFAALLDIDTKQRWENKICRCAAEEAAKDMHLRDVVKLADENARKAAISGIGVRAVAQCTKKWLTQS